MRCTVIRAFYDHHIHRLDVFRLVYCQTQLYTEAGSVIDEDTLREEVHPHTRLFFDRLEAHLAGTSASDEERRQARQRAFSAWTSALGLITMLSIADANQDPLLHADRELLETLAAASMSRLRRSRRPPPVRRTFRGKPAVSPEWR